VGPPLGLGGGGGGGGVAGERVFGGFEVLSFTARYL
jgi:hypothetical protein